MNKSVAACLFLTVIYLAVFTTFSYLAPVGNWENIVLNVQWCQEHDPAGPYFFSAVDIMEYDPVTFVAGSHPGLTLQYFIHAVQSACYHLAGDKNYSTLQEYVARNMTGVFFWVKVAMSLLHLLSFYLLFKFASMLVEKRSAILGVVLYATSFPVLNYISRISPEPFIVIIFLLTAMILYRIHDNTIRLSSIGGISAVLALAVLAVSGIYTKIHILAAGPLIVLGFIVYSGWRQSREKIISSSTAIVSPLVFSLAGVLLFLYFTDKIDWKEYFVFWRGVLQGDYHAYPTTKEAFDPIRFLSENASGMIKDFAGLIWVFLTKHVVYHFRVNNQTSFSTLMEWELVALAVFGIWAYLKTHWRSNECRGQLRYLIWPGIFLLFNFATYIIKPRWNYLFLFQAVFSIFAAYGVYALIERYLNPARISKPFVVAIAVICIHFHAIIVILNSRFDDTKFYRESCKPYFEGLSKVEKNERLGIVYTVNNPKWYVPFYLTYSYIDERTKAIQAIKSTHALIKKDELIALGSSSEIENYFETNKIGLVIELDDNGQIANGCISPQKWIKESFLQP